MVSASAILCVGRTDGSAFSEVEFALFRGVSAAAALAIANATLYRVQAEYAAVMQATADAILAVDAVGCHPQLQQGRYRSVQWALRYVDRPVHRGACRRR